MRKFKPRNQPLQRDERGNMVSQIAFVDLGPDILGREAVCQRIVMLRYPGEATGHQYFKLQTLFVLCLHGTVELCAKDVDAPSELQHQLLSAGEGAVVPPEMAYAIYSMTPHESGPAMVQIFSTGFPDREYAHAYEVPRPASN